jgi:hypothetical protein
MVCQNVHPDVRAVRLHAQMNYPCPSASCGSFFAQVMPSAVVAMMSSSFEEHLSILLDCSEATKLLKPAPVPSIRELTWPSKVAFVHLK